MKKTGHNEVVFAVACMTLTLLFEIECLECHSIGVQKGRSSDDDDIHHHTAISQPVSQASR